jgi:hypothetical protein
VLADEPQYSLSLAWLAMWRVLLLLLLLLVVLFFALGLGYLVVNDDGV